MQSLVFQNLCLLSCSWYYFGPLNEVMKFLHKAKASMAPRVAVFTCFKAERLMERSSHRNYVPCPNT